MQAVVRTEGLLCGARGGFLSRDKYDTVGWWGKEQTQLKGYCRSPGEGCWRPGWGSHGGDGDSERSVSHCRGGLKVSGDEARTLCCPREDCGDTRWFSALFPLSPSP